MFVDGIKVSFTGNSALGVVNGANSLFSFLQ
jgi:hypothetical protein